ncbi:hypothetical protein J6590_028077 [Homalodisca vitripennis]|nr:hypothetical protein J6590_028077 [Homalodisca vitripennis]
MIIAIYTESSALAQYAVKVSQRRDTTRGFVFVDAHLRSTKHPLVGPGVIAALLRAATEIAALGQRQRAVTVKSGIGGSPACIIMVAALMLVF